MGELLKFVGRHTLASFFGAIGVISLALGYADQAQQISTKFEPWAWQGLGATLIITFIVLVLAKMDSEHRARSAVPAAAPSQLPDPQQDETKAFLKRQSVNRELGGAMDAASYAVSTSARECDITLPRMRAALLSAEKLYGTPLIEPNSKVRVELQDSKRMIEQMLPYLKAGHVEEAKAAAEAFLKSLKDINDLI